MTLPASSDGRTRSDGVLRRWWIVFHYYGHP